MASSPDGQVAFVSYPGMTLLDLAGPLQVLCVARDVGAVGEVVVVAESTDTVETDTPLRVRADHRFEDVPDPAVVVVPGGGVPTLRAMSDPAIVDYVRHAGAGARAGAQRTCSVCTGPLIPGAAGLLDGRRATTHCAASRERPRGGGRRPRGAVRDRVRPRSAVGPAALGIRAARGARPDGRRGARAGMERSPGRPSWRQPA